MQATLVALAGFVAWSLLLLVLMETIRSWLVLTGAVPANGLHPDNANLSPFMRPLARKSGRLILLIPSPIKPGIAAV